VFLPLNTPAHALCRLVFLVSRVHSKIDATALFNGFDADHDGKLSPNEFLNLLCANGTYN
jgi:hypothetical protein